jgi:integrase
MGEPQYRLGKLNGRPGVTWWEDGSRRRYRLPEGLFKAELQAEYVRFVQERERSTAKDLVTIADIVMAYVRDRDGDGKSTIKMRTSWKTLATIFAALQSGDIDKAVCHSYWDLRAKAGCSKGTTWTDLSCLRAALNWALATKRIKEEPKIWLPQQPPPQNRFLTREEAQRLLDACDLHHLKLFVLLALGTGARAGAILELT